MVNLGCFNQNFNVSQNTAVTDTSPGQSLEQFSDEKALKNFSSSTSFHQLVNLTSWRDEQTLRWNQNIQGWFLKWKRIKTLATQRMNSSNSILNSINIFYKLKKYIFVPDWKKSEFHHAQAQKHWALEICRSPEDCFQPDTITLWYLGFCFIQVFFRVCPFLNTKGNSHKMCF